jgi:prepilin-type N-terminal cleavage/methylation domain-containing protein
LRNSRGYSLIEVLIGSVLIAIAIVGVFNAVSHGSRMSRQDFLTRRAYLLLEQILEAPEHSYRGPWYIDSRKGVTNELVSQPTPHNLGTVVLDDRDTPGFPDDDLTGNAELSVADMNVNMNIDPSGVNVVVNSVWAKRLTARIKWTEEGVQQACSLETIITLVNIN